MTSDIIQAKYELLEQIAARFAQEAETEAEMGNRIRQVISSLQQGGWVGIGADAFFDEMDSQVLPTHDRLIQALKESQKVTHQIITAIQEAEIEAANLFKYPEYLAIPLAASPPNATTTPDSGDHKSDDSTSRGTLREQRTDRRMDRNIRSDGRWRREEGGDGSGHFSNDWAGRSILERYLTGDGDWNIKNDPRWTKYMQNNPTLTNDLKNRAVKTAHMLHQTGKSSTSIDETFPMEIENGEGIVGYQYLHGTNANAGGFERKGIATITPNASGGSTVRMKMTYTWNDVIDPNPKYSTDRWKSTIAEIVTLGQADAYEIHIAWSETTVIQLDANGNPLSINNE